MSVSNRKVSKEIPEFCQIDILDLQAGLVMRKMGFTTWEWEEEIIVLSMDYFQLPFTILIREMNIGNFVDKFSLFYHLSCSISQTRQVSNSFLKWSRSLLSLFHHRNSDWKILVSIKEMKYTSIINIRLSILYLIRIWDLGFNSTFIILLVYRNDRP